MQLLFKQQQQLVSSSGVVLMCSSSTMYTHCMAFTFAALSVSVFVARVLAAPGPDCTRRANGIDTSTRTARCFLPGNQPLVFPDDK